MPTKAIELRERIKKLKEDPEFHEAYEAVEREYELIEELVRRRKALKMPQLELARRAGVTQQAISRLEKDKHIPKMDTFIKIASALDLKLTLTLK